jgi:bleomycin hydrolase
MKLFFSTSFFFLFLFPVIGQVDGSRGTTEMKNKGGNSAEQEILIKKNQLATPVKNQQQTGTCWAFSTASLLESQALRSNKLLDLSEMYVVRNIYIEKAKNYILRQGKTQFSEGGLGHDLIRAVALYGAVPENVYNGLTEGNTEYNHSAMVADLKSYLDTLLAKPPVASGWLNGYIKLLNKTMGIPASSFSYNNQTYTPQTFAKEALRFNANDYVNITSFLHHPFYQSFILEVPDNFSNGSYYNLPLNEMLDVIKSALNNGYTIMWDADVSNSGFQPKNGFALYQGKKPFGDSSTKMMNEMEWSDTARQRMFEELTTQDDHLMHIVSMENKDGKTFFNVKNSWGEHGPFKGYIKASEAYIAMNTISIVIPKAALPKTLLDKLK